MKISKMLGRVSTFALSLFVTAKAYADDLSIKEIIPTDKMVGGERSVLDIAEDAIKLAILLAALVSVAVLVGAGYSYITAAGDEQKVEKATKTLTYAIVGLVICFISVILVEFVLNKVLDVETATQLLQLYV